MTQTSDKKKNDLATRTKAAEAAVRTAEGEVDRIDALLDAAYDAKNDQQVASLRDQKHDAKICVNLTKERLDALRAQKPKKDAAYSVIETAKANAGKTSFEVASFMHRSIHATWGGLDQVATIAARLAKVAAAMPPTATPDQVYASQGTDIAVVVNAMFSNASRAVAIACNELLHREDPSRGEKKTQRYLTVDEGELGTADETEAGPFVSEEVQALHEACADEIERYSHTAAVHATNTEPKTEPAEKAPDSARALADLAARAERLEQQYDENRRQPYVRLAPPLVKDPSELFIEQVEANTASASVG